MPRQRYPKASASLALGVGWAVNGDLPIMLFHDRIDQCKAEAGAKAGIFGGEKRLEQTVDDGFGYTRAFIFNQQFDGLRRGLGGDPNGTAGRGGVAGMGEQVDQHLREALRVADPFLKRLG